MTTKNSPQKKKKTLWIILAIVGFILTLCIFLIVVALIGSSKPEFKATLTAGALAETEDIFKILYLDSDSFKNNNTNHNLHPKPFL